MDPKTDKKDDIGGHQAAERWLIGHFSSSAVARRLADISGQTDTPDGPDMKDATGAKDPADLGEDGRFAFTFDDEDKPDSLLKVIRSVRFPIGCYEARTRTLAFEPAATQLEALEAVRAYLDRPVDRAYFDAASDDIDAAITWETLTARGFARRGDLLGYLVRYRGFAPLETEGAYDLQLGS